jgi:hypothetical protein
MAFVRALKAAGLDRFDAYDHHPYGRGEAPGAAPTGHSQITLANIDDLTDEVARLWGRNDCGSASTATRLTAAGRPKPAFTAFQHLRR